jgi:hypothetical protein
VLKQIVKPLPKLNLTTINSNMKQSIFWGVAIWVLLWPSFDAKAQLSVAISPVEFKGNKAVVKLAFKNDLTNAVESARASVFLLSGETVVGQETRWVIGGTKDKPSLAPGATNSFFFVITSDKPFPGTKLTTKVNFNRVVLEGGKLADLTKDVKVSNGN